MSAVYPKFKENAISKLIDLTEAGTDVFKAVLLTSVYTYSAAHNDYADLTGVVKESNTLASKTVLSGLFDAADVVVPSVTGSQVTQMAIFLDTGVAANDLLVCHIDGFAAVTPNGGDINIAWDNGTNKIFQL